MTTSNLSWNESKMHKNNEPETLGQIDIDWLLFDVLILKAECLANKKLLSYCQHLEDQLFKLKNKEAILEV